MHASQEMQKLFIYQKMSGRRSIAKKNFKKYDCIIFLLQYLHKRLLSLTSVVWSTLQHRSLHLTVKDPHWDWRASRQEVM